MFLNNNNVRNSLYENLLTLWVYIQCLTSNPRTNNNGFSYFVVIKKYYSWVNGTLLLYFMCAMTF